MPADSTTTGSTDEQAPAEEGLTPVAAAPLFSGAAPLFTPPTPGQLTFDDAQDEVTDGEADEDAEEAAPTLPSFGLVFQAPDLTDVPRRPRQRPTPVAAQEEDDAAAADQDGADEDATDSDEFGEGGGTAAQRRRRRGGKGRRRHEPDETQTQGPQDGRQGQGQDHDQSQDRVEGEAQDGAPSEEGDPAAPRANTRTNRRTSTRGTSSAAQSTSPSVEDEDADLDGTSRRRRRRRRNGEAGSSASGTTSAGRAARNEVSAIRGSTRLEAKRQRRREGREAGRRRTIITEAEFLARRESVERVMVVRGMEDRTQIAVLEDGVAVEHYVSRATETTMVGNVYLGRVQNVLPSMEAAFVDIGRGRNAVLYAGEVNWDAAGLDSNVPKRIENALKSGESVLVQVTKDPIGHKGARLTSQISLPGRYLVYVPGHSMTGISRKLPENERARLKKILKEIVPTDAGVIVRTAAEGATEAELRSDVERLTAMWERIEAASKAKNASTPSMLHGEPDMMVRVIRDVFNEDFSQLIVSGEKAWGEVKGYIDEVAPDLSDRVEKYTGTSDIFSTYRVNEAISKAMDRKVWLPSGGSLVIDRTEAMTVVDVNTGKFTGSGGNLEETVTKNNIEAAEEIVRQLRLRDIGGIIVIDFIDMVLESNRDLVVRRLLECLGRDRTKHQVAEVTSLGLVQMTRKRVGSGLLEVFSENCAHCNGRGVIVHTEPVGKSSGGGNNEGAGNRRGRGGRTRGGGSSAPANDNTENQARANGPTPAQIAAAAHAAAVVAGASDTGKKADEEQRDGGQSVGDGPLDKPSDAGKSDTEKSGAEKSDAEKAQAGKAVTQDAKTESKALIEADLKAALEAASQSAASGQDQSERGGADQEEAPSGASTTREGSATTSAQPAAPTRARRGSRRAGSKVTTPTPSDTPVMGTAGSDAPKKDAPEKDALKNDVLKPIAESAAADVSAAQATPPQATPASAPEPPAPRRSRRARVVAPAGPPSAAAETVGGASDAAADAQPKSSGGQEVESADTPD